MGRAQSLRLTGLNLIHTLPCARQGYHYYPERNGIFREELEPLFYRTEH